MNTNTGSTTQSQHVVPHVAKANSSFSRNCPGLLASLGIAALLLGSAPALAVLATEPNLGTAAPFAVLSATASGGGAVTCTRTIINGDVGSTGGPITINTFCTVSGTTTTAIPDSPVVNDFNNAYGTLTGGACDILNGTLAGASPVAGVYCIDPSGKTGTLTLSGNSTDIWIFKSSGAAGLAGTNFNVVMAGTAQACNVYWWSEAAAAMTTSNFNGTILAGQDITVTGGTFAAGRALAKGAVTMTDGILTGCPPPPATTTTTAATTTTTTVATTTTTTAPTTTTTTTASTTTTTVPIVPPATTNTAVPTLSEWAMIMLAALLAIAGFVAIRRRAK